MRKYYHTRGARLSAMSPYREDIVRRCIHAACWLASLILAGQTYAEVVAKFEFTGLNYAPTQTNEHVSGSIYDFTSDSASQATGWSGIEGNPGAAFLVQAMADSTESYLHFTLSVTNGYALTLDSLTFDSKRRVDAPTSYDVKYSTNGTVFTSIGNGSLSGTNYQAVSADNGGTPVSDLRGVVYFRIHGDTWYGKAGPPPVDDSQTWYHDNVIVNGSVSSTVPVDVGVTKTVDNAAPAPGDSITFTITVTNVCPNDATGIEITDVLPIGVRLVSSTPDQGTYESTNGVWTVSSLSADAGATLIISATVDLPTEVLNIITNPTPENGDDFGSSASSVGESMFLVGDNWALSLSPPWISGEAYLYSTDGSLIATITNPTLPAATTERFGSPLCSVGDSMFVVGDPADLVAGIGSVGGAYLYSTNGTLLASITNPTPAADDVFGWSVCAVGDSMFVVGDMADDPGGIFAAGGAYLYSTNGDLLMSITNPSPAASDRFGDSACGLGDSMFVVSAIGDSPGGITGAGAAYLYSTNGNLLATITNPTPTSGDSFGHPVWAVGDSMFGVGAYGVTVDGFSQAGSAYLYSTNGTLLATMPNPDPATYDYFPFSGSAVGETMFVVGSGYHDADGVDRAGIAYLYSTNGDLLSTIPNPAPTATDDFGISAAGIGDTMFVVGARGDGPSMAGSAYLHGIRPDAVRVITNAAVLTAVDQIDTNAANDSYSQSLIVNGAAQTCQVIVSNQCATTFIRTAPGQFAEHLVAGSFYFAFSVYAKDVDGDGDIDVLGAAWSDDEITWWENIDGAGTNWSEHIVDGSFDGAVSVSAADLDGDGDVDVFGGANMVNDINWWENTDGTGTNWSEHVVDDSFAGAVSVCAKDIDGDTDLDVLAAGYGAGEIAWWENTDGYATNWSKHSVVTAFAGAASVCADDLDGDGDLDILGAANMASNITWWENTDGCATNWTEHNVTDDFDQVNSVHAADLDGDGDLDVVGAAMNDDDITWWENVDGGGTSWSEHSITSSYDGAVAVYAADVDFDGDTDVIGAAFYADAVTWWENTDGTGTNLVAHTLADTFDGPWAVHAADVDGDGDLDVLSSAYDADEVRWWQNDSEVVATFYATSWTNTLSPATNLIALVTNNVAWGNSSTQFACSGWTRDGSHPGSGSGPYSGRFDLTNDAVIVFNWSTQYWLEVTAGPYGNVDGSDGWQNSGSNVTLTATPINYYHLINWTGTITSTDNPLGLSMSQAYLLTANFAENLVTNATPQWWLAQYELGTNDADALAHDDADGMPNWQEYIADTDPTNTDSALRILDIVPESGAIRVEWQGGEQAWQYLQCKEDLVSTTEQWFAIFTNIPPTATATNVLDVGSTNRMLFYRIKAERP